jgi:two-component system, NarL family, sensor histidine kinase DegS
MPGKTATAPTTIGELAARLSEDLATLDNELSEVDVLITQARSEAGRHEARRFAAEEKLAGLTSAVDATDRVELATSLVTLTKRAALMETQVEVLEGKRRALARYRDAVSAYGDAVQGVDPATALGTGGAAGDDDAPMPGALSRVVLGAQEDLRREIARAMHDGPAQSLTNIVLQAQIVEHLVARDPSSAAGEVRELIAMVQHTLDATKSFIFDVRPMVLDDLGLVPTLRRAARERGRRAGTPVDFDSMGQDRRLSVDLESGLFRMLDEALAAYLEAKPDRVALRLDWSDRLEVHVNAERAVVDRPPPATGEVPPATGADLPPALAAMMEQRRADELAAGAAALRESIVALPDATWREIRDRAASIGVSAELLADGGELRLLVDVPPIEPA